MHSATAGSSVGVRLRTHAKINLFLRVVGRRPDGFHEIESIFHGVSLADEVTLTPTGSGDVDVDIRVARGTSRGVPEREENLAYLAARALIDKGVPARGVRIDI